MARLTKKGRRANGPPFIQLFQWMYDSPAFRSLRPGPRAVILALLRRYNGNNNGSIALGVRDAAIDCGVRDKDTVAGYFAELERKGFIVATRRGAFHLKDPTGSRATEWRLTWLDALGVKATKEFLKWTPDVDEKNLRSGKSGYAVREKPTS
jgi:hypothetical protein